MLNPGVPIWGLRVCWLSMNVAWRYWEGRTHRRNDALPNLALEAQIGLPQLGAFLTKLSNLRALCEKVLRGRVVKTVNDGTVLTDFRTTSKIWVNMASTLETLAPPEVG